MSLEAAVLPSVIPHRLPRLPAREQGWPAQGEDVRTGALKATLTAVERIIV